MGEVPAVAPGSPKGMRECRPSANLLGEMCVRVRLDPAPAGCL